MPYTIDWYIQDEVVYIHYSGESTADELRSSLTDTVKMIESSPRELVHVIADVGDITKALAPKESLNIVREVGSHARTGWNIVLREQSVIIKIGVAFGTSIFKSRTRAFDTIEQVDNFLAEKDMTLNWDQVDKSIVMS